MYVMKGLKPVYEKLSKLFQTKVTNPSFSDLTAILK